MITIREILTMLKEELIEVLKAISTESHKHCWYIHKGDGLPCLVAHIDTVHDKSWTAYKRILTDGDFYMSPTGLGADDRAGVYALLKLYTEGLEANFLFTDLEESGGIGAFEACEALEKYLEKTPYFIEIDRRGCLEAVFYNDEKFLVPEFVEAIEDTGFSIGVGSFTDISIIGDVFQVASVNLSAGFWNEHTSGEFFCLSWLKETIERVPKLIEKLGLKRYSLNNNRKQKRRKEDVLWKKFYLNDELAEMVIDDASDLDLEDLAYLRYYYRHRKKTWF